MTRKRALITAVTGQDGAYLAELLLDKGYEVHGIERRSWLFNTDRVDHLYQDPHESERRFILHYGDLSDATNPIGIVQSVQPDEILQARCTKSRRDVLRNRGVHGECRRARHAAAAGSDQSAGPARQDALLPGLDLGDVRQGAGVAAVRAHTFLSALAVRRREGVGTLDHRQLPGSVWPVRVQRHPVQPRVCSPCRCFSTRPPASTRSRGCISIFPDQRARRWLLDAVFLPAALREVLQEHDENRRVEWTNGGLLMVISDFTYEDESDPWEVTPIWCYAARHLLITGRVHALKSTDELRQRMRTGVSAASGIELATQRLDLRIARIKLLAGSMTRQLDEGILPSSQEQAQ